MTKPIDIKEISTRNKDFELALKKVCRRITMDCTPMTGQKGLGESGKIPPFCSLS